MRKWLLCAIAAILVAMGSAGSVSATQSALTKAEMAKVQAATRRTLAVNSVRVDQSAGPSNDAGWFVLEKPNSMHSGIDGGSKSFANFETITIGRDSYTRTSTAGYWLHVRLPRPTPAFTLFELYLGDTRFDRREGDRFVGSLNLNGVSVSIAIRIVDGYVVEITSTMALTTAPNGVAGNSIASTLKLSQFGSAPKITAPPAALVREMPINTAVPAPKEIKIPSPVSSERSTLQFRPVLGTNPESACLAVQRNPDPTVPTSLRFTDGCLSLGPAGFEIAHAASMRIVPVRQSSSKSKANPSSDSPVDLEVTLESGDAARFDRLTVANVQKRLALVMFGRVLSAPVVNAPHFNGSFQITGVTMRDASLIKRIASRELKALPRRSAITTSLLLAE